MPQPAEGVVEMARVRENPRFESWFTAHVGAQVKKITEAVAADAIAGCPIDSGDTVETIRTRYPGRLRGVIIVGTDHWAAQEYGAAPHWITSSGRWSLHNVETGEYFGRRVWHPGNQAQPFLRPALLRKRKLSKARV